MSETPVTSGTASVSSGADGQNVGTSGGEQAAKPTSGGEVAKTYPEHFVEKLKKEKDNQSKVIKELKAEIDEIKAARLQGEEDELAKNQKYKELWEGEKQKREQAEQTLNSNKALMAEARKKSAIKTELLKLGLNPEHEKTVYKLMDHSTVFEDEQTGVMVGAEDAAKTFYDQYRSLGFFGKPGPGVEQRSPLAQSAKPARKSFSEMSRDELAEEYRKLNSVS